MTRDRARDLRTNSTDAERKLWAHIRRRQVDGFRFRRQQPIGPFIVDFYCPEARLIVEVDGGQHVERAAADAERTGWLESRGYHVVRYWNNEVMQNIEGVIVDLTARLSDPHPPP